MLVKGELHFTIQRTELDRYCSIHDHRCVSEVDEVIIDVDHGRIDSVMTGNTTHLYKFTYDNVPLVLVPGWLEELL